MKKALLLFTVPGVTVMALTATYKVSDDQQVTLTSKRNDNGALIVVADGQYDNVTAWMKNNEINPANVLLDEDNAMMLDDQSVDTDFQRQVILVLSDVALMDAKPIVTKADIAEFKKPGFLGPQFIAVQDADVNTTGLDNGYNPVSNTWAKRATKARFDQYIDQNNHAIVGSVTGANEIVFVKTNEIGRDHYGMLAGRDETFKAIDIDSGEAIDGTNYRSSATMQGLHIAHYGGKQIQSISSTQLASYFHGDLENLEWSTATVSEGTITDLSNDIGDGTLLVSTDGGEYGHIPGIELYGDSGIQLNLVQSSGIPTSAYSDGQVIPLGRVTSVSDDTALYASLEPNGSAKAVTFGKVQSGEEVDQSQKPWETALGALLGNVRSGQFRQDFAQAV